MTRTKLLVLTLVVTAVAWGQSKAERRCTKSAEVLNEIMGAPDKSIPQDLFARAHCVAIVPGLIKGAFIVGGKKGSGVISCRGAGGKGWTPPSTIRIEGGSFGLQIGGSSTDVVLLVMNEAGKRKLLESKFTLGADASAAAGPVGRTAQAQTDAQMHAEILSYSRARGVFAGISLEGATLRGDADEDRQLYGQPVSRREILAGNVEVPAAAAGLLAELNKYSSEEHR